MTNALHIGSTLRGTVAAAHLRRSALSIAAGLFIGGNAWAVPSATVLFASGEAHVLSAAGASRPARSGAVIESGESIETGKGTVQLRMVDGAMMSLNERTLLRMDDYHLAGPAGNDERGYMSLVRGALRTISGSIGKPRVENYKLDTPTGTIGIRGTEYTAAIDDGLKVGVINGRVAVCNDGGCVDVPKGSNAYTPNRSTRPAVSARVSVVVPPTGSAPQATLASTDAATTSSTHPWTTPAPTAGERVSQYLVAALSTPTSISAVTATGNSSDELPQLAGAIVPSTATGTSALPATSGPVLVTVSPAPSPLGPVPSGGTTPTGSTATPSPSPTTATSSTTTTSPSPTPAPAPAGSPAAAPSPAATPVAAPTSAPAAAPTSLPSGAATLGLVWTTDKGELGSGLTQGSATFDATGALTSLDDLTKGKKILDKGVPVDPNSDGIVTWGRWTAGESNVQDANGKGKGKLATLHYFAFATSPTLPVTGTFASFGSTAPTVQSNGNLVATGSLNGATGSLSAVFLTAMGGTGTYTLSVPVPSQTFTLAGVATQTSAFGFSGISLISSTGQACATGCTGSLGKNVSVIGLIGGPQGNRAGITYGFDSAIGNVSGVIVFKR